MLPSNQGGGERECERIRFSVVIATAREAFYFTDGKQVKGPCVATRGPTCSSLGYEDNREVLGNLVV
ncbi:unnamed protein product [Coregonus sp. 'balchen']|nr:unnamed protein product [Coregonus sp. 'balchen']